MQQRKPNAVDEGWKNSIPKVPKQLSGESGVSLDDSNSSGHNRANKIHQAYISRPQIGS